MTRTFTANDLCIICGNKRPKARDRNGVTCKKDCERVYERVYQHVRNNIRSKYIAENDKLKKALISTPEGGKK